MTETTLNKEQEAFLAYMDASKKTLEGFHDAELAFKAYEEAATAQSEACEAYNRMIVFATAAFTAYSQISADANAQSNKTSDLHGEWVKVRGY